MGEEFLEATAAGDINKVSELIRLGTDINYFSESWDKTALMLASEKGYIEITKLLIENGANLEIASKSNGFTALFWGSFWGDEKVDVVSMLLEHGANVNHKNFGLETALFRAADQGDVEIVKLLIKYGVDLKIKDSYGATALKYAQSNGQAEVVEILTNAVSKKPKKKWWQIWKN